MIESPAYKLINILIKKFRCKISYHDPYIKEVKNLKTKILIKKVYY